MSGADSFHLKRLSFGKLLRHFRVQRLLTATELGRIAGVSRSHISMLEHGRRRPKFTVLRNLCQALVLEGEEFTVFVDAALRQAPAHMRDLPASGSSLDEVLSPQNVTGQQGFTNLNMPAVTREEQEFLAEVVTKTPEPSQPASEVHACSQVSTTPQNSPQTKVARAGRKDWRAPIRHPSKAAKPKRRGRR